VHGRRGHAEVRAERADERPQPSAPSSPATSSELALQPSQHVTLGIHQAVTFDRGRRELEALGPGVDGDRRDGRILACYGFGYQWPPTEKTGGHALAWAMLAEGARRAHVAITRFAATRSRRARSTGSRRSSAPTSRPNGAGPSWSAFEPGRELRAGARKARRTCSTSAWRPHRANRANTARPNRAPRLEALGAH
jgi:hypothetical protein